MAETGNEQEHRARCEFICDLSHLGFLRARGDDALAFVNGQLTNDLDQLTDTGSQPSGYCTPKGRLLCVFRIHREGDDLLMQTRVDLLPAVGERLCRYILRSRVTLVQDPTVCSFGVVGAAAAKALVAAWGALPEQRDGCRRRHGVTVIRHAPDAPARYQVIATATDLIPLWRELCATCAAIGSWGWASIDIAQGLPTVLPSTSELFVPQHLNMDITGGVSFRKGCFPGQEVVARMRYLGKLKTRMALGYVEAEPAAGDKVYPCGAEQSTGVVVDAAPAGGGFDILATARLEHLAQDALCVGGPDGARVRLRPLPYPLETPEQRQA